jgi:hypothetical protein
MAPFSSILAIAISSVMRAPSIQMSPNKGPYQTDPRAKKTTVASMTASQLVLKILGILPLPFVFMRLSRAEPLYCVSLSHANQDEPGQAIPLE